MLRRIVALTSCCVCLGLWGGQPVFAEMTPATESTALLLNLDEGNDQPKDAANKDSTFDMVGVTWSDEGHTGKCLKFNGEKGAAYLLVESDRLAVKTPAITVEAWVKQVDRTAFNNEQFVIAQGNMQGYQIVLKEGCVQFFVATDKGFRGVEASPKTRIPLGTWNHVAGVYDGSTVKVYVNGNERNSMEFQGGNVVAGRKCYLGARGDLVEHTEWGSPSCFRGFLDEVRISTVAKTPAELAKQVMDAKATPAGK